MPALLLCLPGIFLAVVGRRAQAYRLGPPPDRVGACEIGPTCWDTDCHDTFGSPTLVWDFGQESGPLPAAYVPGRTYTLRLHLRDDDDALYPPDRDAEIWGFELAPLLDCPVDRMGGEIALVDAQRTRLTAGPRGITYISHACPCSVTEDPSCCGFIPEADPNENGWSFLWTAPPRGSGTVQFYFSINAANHNGAPTFDRIVPGSVDLPEETCPVPPPRDLRLERAECDGGQPGVTLLDLQWTPGDPGDVVRETSSLADLPLDRSGWADAGGACLPLDDGRDLVFYSVGRTCDQGGEAH